MLPYDLFSRHELDEVSKYVMWASYSIRIHEGKTVYEHEYYAKVKSKGEVASKREDKLTEY